MLSREGWTAQRDGRRRFRVVLVKPSHYDDDGYVIRWLRSPMPANSLAASMDCSTIARGAVLGPTSISTSSRSTRPIPASTSRPIAPHARERQFRLGRPRRRPIQPISARARYRAAVARGRHPGRHRRFPCLRLHGDVRARPRSAGGADLGVTLFAGEAEGRMENVAAATPPPAAKPLYNYIDDLPAHRRRSPYRFCPIGASSDRRRRHELRRRTRLSVSMLVLHHHQRAGAQVAPSHARRRRAHHAREFRAGHRPLLHHRRQFRAQQGLGADLRPPHQAARGRRHDVHFLIQVDTLCHKIPNFIEKASAPA